MKLITYRKRGSVIATGVVVDGGLALDVSEWIPLVPVSTLAEHHCLAAGIPVASGGILRLLQGGAPAMAALARHVRAALESGQGQLDKLSEITLYAPVPRPGKIVAIGRNYADHAKETGTAPFQAPRVIAKLPSAVAAPAAAICCPVGVTKPDFEVELAVVMGGYARNVSEADALDMVAGYTVLNDLSAREFQFDVAPAQTTFAKSFDGFAPMGPWLVTRDEIADPQALEVTAWLNGAVMQHGHTADMQFPVATLIAYLSRHMTLEPGDVIATGTPAGSGAFRSPPRYLQPGDRLRFEVSGVGALEHTMA